MTPLVRNLLIAGGAMVFLVVGLLAGAIGWHGDVVSAQEGVKAQWRDNQNQYDSFWKKVQESAQVPGQYKDDFKDLLVSETEAKYGEKGSQAQMQWFKDRNITFSDKMYVTVQNLIESGRNDFKRGQTELIDRQRKFATELRSFPGNLLASLFGMPDVVSGKYAPKEDADGDGKLTVLDYPIVTSTKTEKIFESGKEDEPVNVFNKK